MKIRRKQIPPEVVKAWHDHCAENTVTTYEEAFAAALAAWPEAQMVEERKGEFALYLPLPQEEETWMNSRLA